MSNKNNKMITELTNEQIDDLLIYTPPYTEQNAANIKSLALEKIKPKEKHKPYYRLILIAAAVMLCLTVGVGAYYVRDIIINKTKVDGIIVESVDDYEFILDEDALGQWEVVDFVREIDDFKTGETQWKQPNFFWLNITFNNDGTAVSAFDTGVNETTLKFSGIMVNITDEWTKGYIIRDNNTIPAYTIKNIDGDDYMFIQWKSGDYTIREMEPQYYVFKRTFENLPTAKEHYVRVLNIRLEELRNADPNITIDIDDNGEIYDTMEYEFVLDEEALGKWNVVDFVRYIDNFNLEIQSFSGDLYWETVKFSDNGKVSTLGGRCDWTKGYILMGDVIPAYTIKNIDGTDYMFIQWKTGDYTVNRSQPCYYVFERAD